MGKIGIIIVYFGKCPDFIRLFLNSCRCQSDIDFIFFTDWDWKSVDVPQNIIRHRTTLAEFNSLASCKVGIDIDVKVGYKLCDMKPAWIHIYEDYLSIYDFVGYCDIDLFFGNIRNFFTEEIALSKDLFTITTSYLSGALTIFKNNSKMRTLYKEAKGWSYIFQDSRHFAFDEYLRVHPEDCEVESYSDLVFRKEREGAIVVKHDEYIGYEKRPGHVTYKNGVVWADGKEWIFYHYVVSKQYVFWCLPDWINIPDSFYVNKYGFYIDASNPIKLLNLFFKKYYRMQLRRSVSVKMRTLKALICKMKFEDIFWAIVKQLRRM